jgi:hypothetical protein
MSVQYGGFDVSYPAGEDLSDDQFRVVRLATDGCVYRPDDATSIAVFGVLQNAPEANEAAAVRLSGITQARFGGTVAINDQIIHEYVSATDAGNIVACGTSLCLTLGICVENGGDSEVGAINLTGLTYKNVAS